MKTTQRLGYQRLAEELVDRALMEREIAQELLDESANGGQPFPAALVDADYVTDWELSRIVCELYNLPFLTVEIASPAMAAIEGLDVFFLIQHQLVPICRHGRVLTVVMPGLAPADVLSRLSSDSGVAVVPVVGTVRSNAYWIEKNLVPLADAPEIPVASAEDATEWASIFDEADAAVLNDLGDALGDDDGSSLLGGQAA